MKSDEQDFYVVSVNETTQIVYDAFQKVMTISTDYTDGAGAPDYKSRSWRRRVASETGRFVVQDGALRVGGMLGLVQQERSCSAGCHDYDWAHEVARWINKLFSTTSIACRSRSRSCD